MLFNSYEFLLVFLPIVLVGYFYLARTSRVWAATWVALASLFFYGYWNPAYVGLLLLSIMFNYSMGVWISTAFSLSQDSKRKRLLTIAISTNIALLAYYKYANFFIANINTVTGSELNPGSIILPLGISFFTFTQIAFLVDTYHGKVREYSFIHYLLFVTYFPHLIAGPVLHHKQMMPQFSIPETYQLKLENIAIGLTFFTIGLAKKVLIADSFSEYATPIFADSHNGHSPQFFVAWVGALAYTFQLYFDFSGYSDMAIGIARMMGVSLPINFNSPYKAESIVEFWRRWHMTLSQFLREYLYFPLGGNRSGQFRRYVNLMITMLLGGLWHGANWTFVVWGGLHGVYLCINHLWSSLSGNQAPSTGRFKRLISVVLTFLAVVFAWVFFRSETLETAFRIIKGMLGGNGLALPMSLAPFARFTDSLPFTVEYTGFLSGFDVPQSLPLIIFWFSFAIVTVWLSPNTQELVEREFNNSQGGVRCRLAGISIGVMLAICLMSFNRVSEFLYFQF